MTYYQNNKRFLDISVRRLVFIISIFFVLTIIMVIRLFFVQIIKYDKFITLAKEQHEGGIIIPARRGEILTRDSYSNSSFKLATNITLDLLYVDPSLTPDKKLVAETFAPFLLTAEDYETCKSDQNTCPLGVTATFSDEDLKLRDDEKKEVEEKPSQNEKEEFKSREELIIELKEKILMKISREYYDYIVLKRNVTDDLIKKIINLNIHGIIVSEEEKHIAVNPTIINASDRYKIAKILEPILNISTTQLSSKLTPQKIQYVPLKRKLSPAISVEIKNIIKESAKEARLKGQPSHLLRGVALSPEHWRHYPNKELASQVLGFFSNASNSGQYGIEESLDYELKGRQGKISAKKDPSARTISFGDDSIQVKNGINVVLTIIPSIQRKIEQILKKSVKKFKARSGQVIIMDPFTGNILAMANYPTFDPNKYWQVYEKESVPRHEEISQYYQLFVDENNTFRIATQEEIADKEIEKFMYKNKIGPEAYRNKLIQDIYEPGSVFKPIAMAIALDREEVNPQQKYLDSGEVKTGEYLRPDEEIIIHNANNQSHGFVTMTECLEQSINTCMAHIAEKLGRQLFYTYLKDFHFGEYTDIEISGEAPGKIIFWEKWSKSQLMTTAFGQGIAATPLQMVAAWSSFANGGVLMKPNLIESKIYNNDEVVQVEPKIIRRILSEKTASTISAMLVSTVNNGVANTAKIDNYLIAGKTGTSQIANIHGNGYEKGQGSTITSFAGYAPVHHPKFVMIVKFDRPIIGKNNTWGSTTAAPVFKEIAKFLFTYFNVPPDA